ncbi:MAG: PilN domain-containing protein [Candidatus Competibacterales bacterium]|nr:PilN domain-containing protein [Candidatus Competibacterales bacterium]
MTTRINLIPWREERRQRKHRNFMGVMVFTLILSGLGVLGAHLYMVDLISYQEQRNQMLRNEIARINRVQREIDELQKTEVRLISRLEAIKSLQQSRPDKVVALDTLVRLLPPDVYIQSFNFQGNRITLRGDARLNNVVSDFMRELEQSPVFGEPSLSVVSSEQVGPDVPVSNFELSVSQRPGARPAD